jgi:hypothetical protein
LPEVFENTTVIDKGEQFELLSAENGTTCILRSNEECSTAQVLGEEAEALLRDYESIKAQYPGYSADQRLAQLWDQGGYSWMAVPDEP